MEKLLSLLDRVTGITCHSRSVQPGHIFVAIRGRTTDGNRFVPQAIANGAAAIVTDTPQILAPVSVPLIAVPDARQALAILAAHIYRHPSHHMSLVGITGTNGKTTIACLLEHIFRQAGNQAGMIGTAGIHTGRSNLPASLTTPDAATTQHYLHLMHENGVTHTAMEVSAQGIELHRADCIHFSCGILTNICPDHLDFHGSFAEYRAAKEKFLSLLSPASGLVVNTDDAQCQAIASRYSGTVITCSLSGGADLCGMITHIAANGTTFFMEWNKPFPCLSHSALLPERIPMHFPLPGRHNAENALLAGAAALFLGISPAQVQQALGTFRGVDRRLNVYHINGRTVIDDTALNPGSIDAVLETAALFRYQRIVLVNAIRGSRGPDINAANAICLARWQNRLPLMLVITSANGDTGPADRVTAAEKEAFLTALERSGATYVYNETVESALQTALNAAGPADLLMLLGAQGMDGGYQTLSSLLVPARTVKIPATRSLLSPLPS
ncbi:mur ligase central [Lucifera butyrica]|uniref:Mur ligase central n=1 Tax=Lucifera butyrica TaxID=1351585 RepID=A0A498R5D0_9FIRM|nr:UDP-N-acetylmuramyl-tripeptide synthetase [Lucifera butyrica]VBB06359.1 mur ligase central [Lucifera butyrica]